MKLSAASAALLGGALTSAAATPGHKLGIKVRAAPDSPSGGYAPAIVDCPSDKPALREATELSKQEKDWVSKRDEKTRPVLDSFLSRVNIKDFDFGSYFKDDSRPRIAISVSGGGYRALMNGAGFLAAADDRTDGSTEEEGIGGLLQSATYLSGLSGGGWLVGSLFSNNWTSVEDMQRNGRVWQFQDTIINGPTFDDTFFTFDTGEYWTEISEQVTSKADAGFDTSLTDYWGRALSYQLIEDPLGGPAYTFSSIADADNFKNGETPFPILVADGRAPGTKIISLNATVFEFNPFEMGSWDPTLGAFVPIEYLGSNFTNGSIPRDGNCVRGFDQMGFVMGTSSSLFNIFLTVDLPDSVPQFVQDAITSIFTTLDEDNDDIAPYTPNPFKDYKPDINAMADVNQLTLVDGGLDLQNIPLQPVLQSKRAVDVIFAVDSSADTPTNWPNGTAMRATYDRSLSPIADGMTFPPVPPANTFINKKLNQRPTFFGCDSANFSDPDNVPPLVVYLPNAPYTASSNVSTFDPVYELEERNAIIQNGYNAGTQGNATLDDDWPRCVACAVLHRSFERDGADPPKQCRDCMERYCWDGSLDEKEVVYDPEMLISASGRMGAGRLWAVVSVGAMVVLM